MTNNETTKRATVRLPLRWTLPLGAGVPELEELRCGPFRFGEVDLKPSNRPPGHQATVLIGSLIRGHFSDREAAKSWLWGQAMQMLSEEINTMPETQTTAGAAASR